jgi:hypothetical protein
MRRIACLLLCAASLAAVAAPARAQQSPFGPLPQEAAPTATPTPAVTGGTTVLGQDVGRATLFGIAGGFVLLFIGIGWWISRDARQSLARDPASDAALARRADPHERHRRQREKERARKKTRAQRQARKAHRKR